MDELRSECGKLREAVDLLRSLCAPDLDVAVGIIEDVIGELAGHDCDDFASECEECKQRDEWAEPDMPDVGECLELGLPHLEAKYGMHSMESETARSVLADLGR